MSIKLNARKLLDKTGIELINGIKGNNFLVEFEDGVVLPMKDSEIVTNRYFWEILNHWPLPIVSKYSITTMYGRSNTYTSDVHKTYFSLVYKDLIQKVLIPTNRLTFANMSSSWKQMFNIIDSIYSELQYQIIEYGVSLNILDFIELSKDALLTKAIADAEADSKNPDHVEIINKRLIELMAENPDNNLAKLFNSGAANRTQISHTLGIRAFVTDINNNIYPEAVLTNLTRGLKGFYDMSCESSVMAKALKLSQFGIKYSEWLQRELHMASLFITNLTLDDCGAGEDKSNYIKWYVKDEKEFKNLLGSNFLYNNVEVEMDRHHSDIIGTAVDLRPIYNCRHLRHGKICMKCMGALSYSIPGFANLGHTLVTMIMAMIGQLMLSAKHYTDSTKLSKIILGPIASEYFKVVEDSSFTLADKLRKHKGKIYLAVGEKSYYGFRLLSSKMLNDLKTMDTSKLSSIDSLHMILVDEAGKSTREFIQIKQDGRSGIFDLDFIQYSLDNNTNVSNTEYIIDVTNYNGNILFLESKEFAFDVFNTEFKTLLTSISKAKKNIPPEEFTHKVFKFISSKLDVNIKIIELLVTALTVEDPDNGDYRVGLNKETRTVAPYAKVISGKTPGVSFGFEKQKNILTDSNTFLYSDEHEYNPLENVFMTKNIEVIRKTKY